MIDILHLTKTYGDTVAVDDLSLHVEQGGDKQHFLLHAFRELSKQFSAICFGDPENMEQLVTLLAEPSFRNVAKLGDELQVFVRRKTLIEHRILRHVTDSLLDFERLFCDVEAGNADTAGRRFRKSREYLDRR
jgi:hypothetical protein